MPHFNGRNAEVFRHINYHATANQRQDCISAHFLHTGDVHEVFCFIAVVVDTVFPQMTQAINLRAGAKAQLRHIIQIGYLPAKIAYQAAAILLPWCQNLHRHCARRECRHARKNNIPKWWV